MTGMDFSAGAGMAGNTDLIPNGQLAFVIINFRGLKVSPNTGTKYLDLELTVDDNQPCARRKCWTNVMDPMFSGNSEGARQMGMVAITRILEAGRGAGPNNQAGYVLQDYSQLHGVRAAVKFGIEPGKDGYADKNKVAEWLTPNPASQSGHKGWTALLAGQFSTAAQKPATPPSGFGAPAAAQPAQTTMFGQPQGGQSEGGFGLPIPAAQPGGFGQPAAQGGQQGFQQPQPTNGGAGSLPATAANPSAPTGGAMAPASPSSGGQWGAAPAPAQPQPGAAPNWLAAGNAGNR